ncbi:MAG: alpha/beta fold hydrolase [Planctomycetota bacterium]
MLRPNSNLLKPAPRIESHTLPDGYCAAARVWRVKEPAAQVVCLHGILSHGGWYLPSGAHLAGEGFDVHLLDRRGSGLNCVAPGDVDRWETWPQDVEHYLERLPPDPPRLLLGISWGGMLAAAVARRRPDLLSGLGLLCPGLYSKKAANALQQAALKAAGILGLRSKRVAIPLKDPALFTSNEESKAFVARDPLSLRKITIGFALANLELTRFACERPEEIRVPALLVLAGDDPITDNPRTRAFFERIGHNEKHLIEYAGASHTLEFEPDPAPYFRDLAQWCRWAASRAPRSPS